MAIFKGAGVAIVTPMKENLEINYDKLDEMLEEQIAGATDAIIICGTTGESATMTEAEHMEAIRFTVERVKHRIPVIAGTGSNCTATAVELSKEAEKDGADGLLLVTPYYNKATQNGLIAHYTAVCKEVKIPAILYNVPSRTGCNIQPATLAHLVKNVDNIVASRRPPAISDRWRRSCISAMGTSTSNTRSRVPGRTASVPRRNRSDLCSLQCSADIRARHGIQISGRRHEGKLQDAAGCASALQRTLLRGQPDPGESSAEPDGQGSRTAPRAAHRDRACTQRASGKSNEGFRHPVIKFRQPAVRDGSSDYRNAARMEHHSHPGGVLILRGYPPPLSYLFFP